MMMMMLKCVNLSVEYVIMSVPILSHKDNYYIFIPSDYVYGMCGGGDRYVYLYIYMYLVYVYICIYILVQFVCHAGMLLSVATMYSCCLVVIYMYMPCRVQFVINQPGTKKLVEVVFVDYYTIIPSIYIQLVDAVDCFI